MFSLTPKALIPTRENWKQTTLGLLAEVTAISLLRNLQVKEGAKKSVSHYSSWQSILGRIWKRREKDCRWGLFNKTLSSITCLLAFPSRGHLGPGFPIPLYPPHASEHNQSILHRKWSLQIRKTHFTLIFLNVNWSSPADNLIFTDAVNFKGKSQ